MNEKFSCQRFIKLCLHTKSEKELRKLFDLFFTSEEKLNIETRVLIVKELLQGNKPQREIANDLGISIAKITRGSNGLKLIDESLRNYLKRCL